MGAQLYQSSIEMTTFGFEVHPLSLSDLLASVDGLVTVKRCASKCNEQQLCRYFDYDTSTGGCRLFVDGEVAVSAVRTSRVGSVRYTADLYSSHGQPCTSSNCHINRYSICDATNTCDCPKRLFWNTAVCVSK